MVREADEKHAGQGLYVQSHINLLPEAMTVGMYSGYLITTLPTKDLHAAVQLLANKKWAALTTDRATATHFLCKANFYLWGDENEITKGVNVEIVNGGVIAEFRIKTYNKC